MLASRGASDSGSDAGSCKVGIVRGEDYMFEFSGKIRVRFLLFPVRPWRASCILQRLDLVYQWQRIPTLPDSVC